MLKWVVLFCVAVASTSLAQESDLRRVDRSPRAKSTNEKGGRGTAADDSKGHGNLVDKGAGDDRVVVSPSDKNAEAFAAFGACTATHVGRGVFLTSGHCVDNHLGLQGFRSTPCAHPLRIKMLRESVACNVITYRYDKTTDYALLELTDPALAEGLPYIPVDYGMDWRKWPQRDLKLYGYSDGKLRMNRECTAKIEATRDRVLHDCNTQGGDSGSALIDRYSGHIIGVHAGGLRDSVNYAYPLNHIPWAETLCVAVAATDQQVLTNNGPPAVLRVSTSHIPFQRMLISLEGAFAKNRARVRLLAPESDIEVDQAWFTWKSSTKFSLREMFALREHRAGPWAVEISGVGDAKSTTKGWVSGRVWICP